MPEGTLAEAEAGGGTAEVGVFQHWSTVSVTVVIVIVSEKDQSQSSSSYIVRGGVAYHEVLDRA